MLLGAGYFEVLVGFVILVVWQLLVAVSRRLELVGYDSCYFAWSVQLLLGLVLGLV